MANAPEIAAQSDDVFRLSDQLSAVLRAAIRAVRPTVLEAPGVSPTTAASSIMHAHLSEVARILAASPASDADIGMLIDALADDMRIAVANGRAAR